MSQIKQILRLYQLGRGRKSIARDLGMSRTTVKEYLVKTAALNQPIESLLALEDHELERVFLAGNPAFKDNRYEQFKGKLDYYMEELGENGVTRQVLWEEYREEQPDGYSRSQFCFHLQQHIRASKPSMVLRHAAGEKLFIDFAGKHVHYTDKETGEVVACPVFVACLPFSDYGFAMAVPSQSGEDFIYALICCLHFLGGCPQIITPDNLKAAITRASRYEPDINRLLDDLANHYGMGVVPTRVYKPKDKGMVENHVKIIYSRVYARMRKMQFFSLEEINKAMAACMLKHDQTRMQEKPWCREERFFAEEKPLLKPLPVEAFEPRRYRELTVAKNNHIRLSEDKHYYSVPYRFIGKKVTVAYTRTMVRIYYQGAQIAVHQRSKSAFLYSTLKEHLCSHHQHYLDRSPEYYLERAKACSPDMYELFRRIFSQGRYPEQLYRTCDGILRLHRQAPGQTDKACRTGVEYELYTYKFIRNIVNNNASPTQESLPKPLPRHGNTRGPAYYNQLSLDF